MVYLLTAVAVALLTSGSGRCCKLLLGPLDTPPKVDKLDCFKVVLALAVPVLEVEAPRAGVV